MSSSLEITHDALVPPTAPRYTLCADGKLHNADVRAVAVTQDDRLLTASRDNTAQIVALPADYEDCLLPGMLLLGHEAFVNFVLYHPCLDLVGDGEACVITGSNDNHVAIWHAQSSALEGVLDGHTAGVCAGAIIGPTSPYNTSKSPAPSSCDVCAPATNLTPTARTSDPGDAQSAASCTKARDANATIATLAETASNTGNANKTSGHTCCNDNTDCSSSSTNGASLLNSWEGDILTGDWSGRCVIFDHTTGAVKQVYTGHTTAVRAVAHITGSALVVSVSGDKTAHVWDVRNAEARQICMGHEDVVQCMCVMPNLLRSAFAGEVEHGMRATTDSGSSSGSSMRWFATGGNDCTVRVWKVAVHAKDTTTKKSLVTRIDNNHSSGGIGQVGEAVMCYTCDTLRGHDSLVYALAWSATQDELASASEDHTVLLWRPSAASSKSGRGYVWCRVQAIHHPCVVWGVTYDDSRTNTAALHKSSCGSAAAAAAAIDDNGSRHKSSCGDHSRRLPRLVTAGADGVVRLWTRQPELDAASTEKQAALEQAVSWQTVDIKVAQSIAMVQQINSDVDMTQETSNCDSVATSSYARRALNKPSNNQLFSSCSVAGLLEPATLPLAHQLLTRTECYSTCAEGTRVFVRGENDVVEMYSWCGGSWVRVGVVVSGPAHTPYRASNSTGTNSAADVVSSNELPTASSAPAQKQWYKGVGYDYLFDVDVEGKALKLGYHRGECILSAAQRFIDDHRGIVYQDSKEEIQNFLLQNLDPVDVALSLQAANSSNNNNASASASDGHLSTRPGTDKDNNDNNNNKDASNVAHTKSSGGGTGEKCEAITGLSSVCDGVDDLIWFDKFNVAGATRRLTAGLVHVTRGENCPQHHDPPQQQQQLLDEETIEHVRAVIAQAVESGGVQSTATNTRQMVRALMTNVAAVMSLRERVAATEVWVLVDVLRFMLAVPARSCVLSLPNENKPSTSRSGAHEKNSNNDTNSTNVINYHRDVSKNEEDEERESGVRWLCVALMPQVMTFVSSPAFASSSIASSLPLSESESAAIVTLWLAANANALLCLASRKVNATSASADLSCPSSSSCILGKCNDVMMWSMALVQQTLDHKQSSDKVRGAVVAVLRNTAVLMRAVLEQCLRSEGALWIGHHKQPQEEVAAAETDETMAVGQCGVQLVRMVGQMLLKERSGSLHMTRLLDVLLIVFGMCDRGRPIPSRREEGRVSQTAVQHALVKEGKLVLFFSLQAMALGSDAQCRDKAAALMEVLQ